ncbi:hypothetical protein E2C01_055607 [Portunus trituberculatus]|uniref:Uncharacterized protein n=1 Tax=Portunus trituberculatus TaxID=210409 RepID=A0A5B7GY53_PORTR|nr:hypothetical protein [Portunus trituberculatus]
MARCERCGGAGWLAGRAGEAAGVLIERANGRPSPAPILFLFHSLYDRLVRPSSSTSDIAHGRIILP